MSASRVNENVRSLFLIMICLAFSGCYGEREELKAVYGAYSLEIINAPCKIKWVRITDKTGMDTLLNFVLIDSSLGKSSVRLLDQNPGYQQFVERDKIVATGNLYVVVSAYDTLDPRYGCSFHFKFDPSLDDIQIILADRI